MAFDDFYRLSVHAVILDKEGRVLQVKATYANKSWGLPGGTLDPGETIHEALVRECEEELGVNISVKYMSGMYFHSQYNSHACIFKCEMPENSKIILSEEHSEYRFFPLEELSPVQRQRVMDCLEFTGTVKSAKF